jgi:hypothetical protein
MEALMETTLAHKQIGWRWIAIAFLLAAGLGGALIMSVAPAQIAPPAPSAHPGAGAASIPNSIPSDAGDIGSFAFGYVEFDWDPNAPGGVPGFDSWPPGSPPRR